VKTLLSRREMIAASGFCLAAAAARVPAAEPAATPPGEPFGYSLNTATVMGHKLSIKEEIELAAKAGWQGIEPWIRNIEKHQAEGGSLADLKKLAEDLGLQIVGAIGFAAWAVDDDAQRAAGLEQLKRDMDLVRQIGGARIAAAPAGINRSTGIDLVKVGQRYRAVLELGREMGVLPQLEIWGSALTLSTAGEAAMVAATANHADACLLLDVYHLHRGGSGFDCLRLLNGAALHVFHVNDYPAEPPREKLNDSDRVYPGDGVAPFDQILRTLRDTGFRGTLSLEVFNRGYWEQDPLAVARTGLEKCRAVVQRALG
jgi:sugar phosphate isomerase/epimerase